MTQRHFTQNDTAMLVTTNIKNRYPLFEHSPYAREAVEQIYRTKSSLPFFLFGFVVMPDHVHFLLHVPSPATVSGVMRTYKMGLSFQTGIAPLWQRRFHIRLAKNPHGALAYIHNNPVAAHLVVSPADYAWSSASGKWDIDPLPW